MPPLARASAHPRLVSFLILPSPKARPCRHQHSSSGGDSGKKHGFSSYTRKIPHNPPISSPSSRCKASFFHSTCRLHAANASEMKQKNHYERLGIPTDATPAEIKKSFYALSKVHHPDANPNDPTASESFSLLSEAYTILSDPSRRTAYDRDTLRLHTSQQAQQHTRHGSYHSSSAGGRPASGLSKRRGTFRGPPPSFYRSGGWGAHSEKRRAAHEGSTSAGGGGGGADSASSQHGGMGPGGDPFGHRDDVPHFDKRQHKRTHEYQDELRSQRSQRRSARERSAQSEMQEAGMGAHFLIVSGVLAAALLAPFVYFQFANLGRRRRDR